MDMMGGNLLPLIIKHTCTVLVTVVSPTHNSCLYPVDNTNNSNHNSVNPVQLKRIKAGYTWNGLNIEVNYKCYKEQIHISNLKSWSEDRIFLLMSLTTIYHLILIIVEHVTRCLTVIRGFESYQRLPKFSLGKKTLLSLHSTGWFQERIRAWFQIRTTIKCGIYTRLTQLPTKPHGKTSSNAGRGTFRWWLFKW